MFENLHNKLYGFLDDPSRDIYEKTFVLLSSVVSIAVGLVALLYFTVGESFDRAAFTALVFFMLIVSLIFAFTTRSIRTGMIAVSVVLVFLYLPGLYIYNGGLRSGAPIWFAFVALFLIMVLEKALCRFFLLAEAVVMVICYYFSYTHPSELPVQSARAEYFDSLFMLFLVSVVTGLIVNFRNRLFRRENKKVREKAKEIDELNRAQNAFFSGMSHEIRTPVNTILGFNELMLKNSEASDDIVHDAVNIRGAGSMLLALVNDIMDLSKIESGKLDIVPVNYNVAELISEIINMVWQGAGNKGLKLQTDISPEIPSVLYGDVVRVKQVLINIINNAIKYTSTGSVTLKMESETVADHEILLVISVSDTGMGIKEESIPYLFDAFKRVDEEENRHIEGTGLGLSIVKQIVDLMGGEISVESEYGKGSTFTVKLPHKVSDSHAMGEVDVSGAGTVHFKRETDRLFMAPSATVLIVDDDPDNLEVEAKLIADTGMTIDKALNGVEALEHTLEKAYDAILMDHIMQNPDGLECMERIRNQVGGLNKNTPIIMLTANSGIENIRLYNASGCDGYLIKPVSSKAMQEMLLNHLPIEKLQRSSGEKMTMGDATRQSGYKRRASVIITADSMSDIPEDIAKELGIPIIPFTVYTDTGMFYDSDDVVSSEVLQYLKDDRHTLYTDCPTVEALEAFFRSALSRAHNVIHITVTSKVSAESERAKKAAEKFDNVTVVDSEFMSSAYGMMVLIAHRMAKQNESVNSILDEIEKIKTRLHCNFILKDTGFLAKRNIVNPRLSSFFNLMNMHLSLGVKDGKFGLDKIYFGDTKKCYLDYIKNELNDRVTPDNDILFASYVDLSEDELVWIEEEIKKRSSFNRIIFSEASAAISVNVGPGTFGLLFMDKGDRDYHVANILPADAYLSDANEHFDKPEGDEAIAPEEQYVNIQVEETIPEETEAKWYETIPGIDADTAMKNSGSEDAFTTVLKIFYDSIESKHDELTGFFDAADWEDYTVKIHALKSSSRLIGALTLGADAEKLEMAGKSGDIDYIKANHARVMDDFFNYKDVLKSIFEKDSSGDGASDGKPVADDFLMESVYEAILDAAGSMDCDTIEQALIELDDYAIPEAEADRMNKVKECFDNFDYEGIINAINGKI